LKRTQANSSTRPYLKKPFTKIGLVEWLKMKALSSSISTQKKKKTVKKKRGGVNMIKVHYMLAWKHHNEKITGLEV
jgi:hypothetical protein